MMQMLAEIEHAQRVIDEFAALLGNDDYGVQTARAAQQAALQECQRAKHKGAAYTDVEPLLRLIVALDRAVIALADDLNDAL